MNRNATRRCNGQARRRARSFVPIAATTVAVLVVVAGCGSSGKKSAAAASGASISAVPSPNVSSSAVASAPDLGGGSASPSQVSISSPPIPNQSLLSDPVKFARYFTELYTFWGQITSDPPTVPDSTSEEARAAELWQMFGPIGKQEYGNNEGQWAVEYFAKSQFLQTGHPYELVNADEVAAAATTHEPVQALLHVQGTDSNNYYLQDLEMSYAGATGTWQIDRYTAALTQIPVPPTDSPTG